MNQSKTVIQESIQEFFQQFAFVDVQPLPGPLLPDATWVHCGMVCCDRGTDFVLLLLAPEALRQAAEGFSGLEASAIEDLDEVVLEMANVLAGNLYEVTHGGRKPAAIGMPQKLPYPAALAKWSAAAFEDRHVLADGATILGGVVVQLAEDWSGEWR